MNRRQFIVGVSGVGLVALVPKWITAAEEHIVSSAENTMSLSPLSGLKVAKEAALLPENALPIGLPLPSLSMLKNTSSEPKTFAAQLTAVMHEVELAAGMRTKVWAYNGQLPGPLIEVNEGDMVEVHLRNQLPQATTIHWHGLPIPPNQDGNPQDAVPAGAERIYRYKLPMDSAGTYWYHPHPHGDTPEQVYRGLAGLMIVRSKSDPLAEFVEQYLVISDLKLTADGQIPDNTADDWMNGREGQFVLINGAYRPKITIAGRQRLRIWNACSARYLRLAIPGQSMTLVGTDGGLLEYPQVLTEILLVPGQRIEVIVGDNSHANTILESLIYDRNKMGAVSEEHKRTLATLNLVAGPSPEIPETLREISDLGKPVQTKKVEFSETMSMDNGRHTMNFLVNGKRYDMDRIDLISKAGDVEVWEIFNNSHMDHPFHLHGTQFLIMERQRDGKIEIVNEKALYDTINLQPYEKILIKVRQMELGIRLFHCHILEHEGQGMMGQLRVI